MGRTLCLSHNSSCSPLQSCTTDGGFLFSPILFPIFQRIPSGGLGYKTVSRCKHDLYLQLLGVLYPHPSPHSTFNNLLNFIAKFLFTGIVIPSSSHFLPQVSQCFHLVSPWKWLYIPRCQTTWLPCTVGFLIGSRKVMFLYIIWPFPVGMRATLFPGFHILGVKLSHPDNSWILWLWRVLSYFIISFTLLI